MGFEFAFPLEQVYLWVAVSAMALVGLAALLRRLDRRQGRRLAQFVELRLAPRLLNGLDGNLRRPLFWFTMLGFGFMALAFSQPHWGRNWEEVSRRSHDIIVCLDTSESMLADDRIPNRLEHAKQKIRAFMDRATGDRFALVAFSGAAEIMCPLTLDHAYFNSVLQAVDTDSISLEGTNIASALETCMEVFLEEDKQLGETTPETRAIILISDGESVAGDAVASAGSAADFARVFVIGVGDPQGAEVTFRDRFGRRQPLPQEGETHVSKLDEATLTRIAMEGNGAYVRSIASNKDVEDIFTIVDRMFTREVSGEIRLQLVNRYQWPLAAAIACFFLEGVWLVLLPWIRRWQLRHRDVEEGVEYA